MIESLCDGERERGATFSEALVAMVLMCVGVVGTMTAFEAADKTLRGDALAARALAMAEARIEAKRAVPWEQVLLDDLDHDGAPEMAMRDDGSGGDPTAGDGIYSAVFEKGGVRVRWTVASPRPGTLTNAGAILIEAHGYYQSATGAHEVHLATLRANPRFIGAH
jgi:hypothetical protein